MNKTILSAAIALAFGATAPTWANPTTNNSADTNDSISQTATASADQSAQTGRGSE